MGAADIPYLLGGERPTAAHMTALFTEFDRRMSLLLAGGKSFFLAQDVVWPAKLLGKCFFFVSDDLDHIPVYAGRAGAQGGALGTYDPTTGMPTGAGTVGVPYDHTMFTSVIAALDLTTVTWDETNKIAQIPAVAGGAYAGLPQEPGMGFFEHSLQAHALMHMGSVDVAAVPYYIQDGATAPPEKDLGFALAEIICEGVGDVNLPVAWDKYSCFRIHNLNSTAITVTFGAAYSLTLQPFECQTVRRDKPSGAGANYRTGGHYFFNYEAGDPRFFWYLPTTGATGTAAIGTGPRASNGMAANNLSNPAGIFDWIEFLSVNVDTWFQNSALPQGWGRIWLDDSRQAYAAFIRDRTVLYDAHPLNASKFGDPSNNATKIGDLIHHKGTIIIARTSLTETYPGTGIPVTTWDSVEFRGYGTIVADFAAKLLVVTTNVDGDLVISNGDAANTVTLIPVGTNLFKQWDATYHETIPTVISLPVTIECLLFESGAGLANVAPALIRQRNLVTSANSRTYQIVNDYLGDLTAVTVDGPDLEETVSVVGTQPIFHGIHSKTVADLLSLKWWGDGALGVQDTAYVNFTNKKLTLTNEGLVLSYDEVITNIPPAGVDSSYDAYAWLAGQLTRKRVIRFRRHGWGYADGGAQTAAFFVPRYGEHEIQHNFLNEVKGKAGIDFKLQHLGARQTRVRLLRRLKTGFIGDSNPQHNDFLISGLNGRFWQAQSTAFSLFLRKHLTEGWYSAFIPTNAPLPYNTMALPLLPEHYNAMARGVNSLTKAFPVTVAALKFRCGDGALLSITPGGLPNFDGAYNNPEAFPVPTNCFTSFHSGPIIYDGRMLNDYHMLEIFTSLGVPIKTVKDFPDDFTLCRQTTSPDGAVWFKARSSGGTCTGATITNTIYAGPNVMAHDFTPNFQFTCTLSAEYLSAAALAAGAATGADCLGTWTPGAFPPTVGKDTKFYVIKANGFMIDGTPIYAGDLLVSTYDYVLGLAGWTTKYLHQTSPGKANSIIPGGGWVQLIPSAADDYYPSITSLGTWDPGNSGAPAALPANLTTGGDFGKYYTVLQNCDMAWVVANGGPLYLKGQLLIWNGGEWRQATSAYDDFNWVTIEDVRGALEAFGFQFLYQELVIPLTLQFLAAERAAGDVPTTNATATITLTGSGSDSGSDVISIGSLALPPDPLPTPQDAVNAFLASGASLDTVQAVALTNGDYGIDPHIPGAQLQFTPNLGGATTSNWKQRVRWDVAGARVGSSYHGAPLVADLKNWTTTPQSFGVAGAEGLIVPAMAPGAFWNWPGTSFRLAGAGFDPSTYCLASVAWEVSVGVPAQYPPYLDPALSSITCWMGKKFNYPSWMELGGISESTAKQYLQYALLVQNGSGIAGGTNYSIVPVGCWNFDGDAWQASADNFAATVMAAGGVGGPWQKWFDPAGAPANKTAVNGLNMLAASAQTLACVLATSNVNIIQIDAIPVPPPIIPPEDTGGDAGTGGDEPYTGE